MSAFIRSVDLAIRRLLTMLLFLVVSGTVAWFVLGVIGFRLSLPAVILVEGLAAGILALNGSGPRRPAAVPPPPIQPVRPRRRLTPEDIAILEGLWRRGLISREQLDAAIREAIPPARAPQVNADDRRGGWRWPFR